MRQQSRRILTGIVIILFLCGVLYAVAVARATAQLREAYATLKHNGRPGARDYKVVENTLTEQADVALWEFRGHLLVSVAN